jgi:hypothetical protein
MKKLIKTYTKTPLGSNLVHFYPNSWFFFKNPPAFCHDISSFRSLPAKPGRLLVYPVKQFVTYGTGGRRQIRNCP